MLAFLEPAVENPETLPEKATQNELSFTLTMGPLNKDRTASNETTLVLGVLIKTDK